MTVHAVVPAFDTSDIPDFLIKSTMGCSVVAVLVLLPFTINNFIYDRFVMGLATSSVLLACCFNIWNGLHGRYSLLVNTYLVTPAGGITITYAMIKLGNPGSYWPYLLTLAYYFVLPGRRAWFFNLVSILIFIPSAWLVLDQSSAIRFSAALAGVSLFAHISMREMNIMHSKLRERAVRDSLTGLLDRTLLEDSLQQAIAQNRRFGMPMVLITLDVDHFKAINDSMGHDSGDQVLMDLGALLSKRTRSSDMAFRVGGEEFQILLHNTDQKGGARVAEDIRQAVEQAALLPGHQVTLSAGVSSLREGMDAAEWTKDCDEKLYRAKAEGRNRVVA